jgi:hypothetical protein
MFSKSMLFGSLLLIGLVTSFAHTAEAGNINTSGTICQNFFAGEAQDVDFLSTGVRNINPSPRYIICSVARSPLAAGATALFYVDATNYSNTTTSCTLTVYTYYGAYVTSLSFTRGPGTWEQSVSFAPGVVGTWDYASLLCYLPGNGNGVIHGVFSVQ